MTRPVSRLVSRPVIRPKKCACKSASKLASKSCLEYFSLKINHRLRRFLDSRAGVVKCVTLNLRAKIGGWFCLSLLARGVGGSDVIAAVFKIRNYSYGIK